MDIWAACKDAVSVEPLRGELVRVIESQEQVATNHLVESLHEQAQLEAMIESSKPSMCAGCTGLHYLLATPFRYPPLRHGSRFGSRNEPSLFYGSETTETALAEAAYYRLLFWSGMKAPPPSGKLGSEHTVFGATYRSARAVRLQDAPFNRFRTQLVSPDSYALTQPLGTCLRDNDIELFQYESARAADGSVNVALFTPAPLSGHRPAWQARWLCETREAQVSFFNKEQGTRDFPAARFKVNGVLPIPAT